MTQVVSGVIDNIYTKEVNTKFGPKPVYIAQVGGQEVNLGFKTPLAMGETVSLNVEHKYGSLQLVSDSVPPASNGQAVSSPQPTTSGRPQTGPAPVKVEFPVEYNSRGTSIIRQNSMVHATRIVEAQIAAGVFTPKTDDDITMKVLQVAEIVCDYSTGQRDVKAADAAAAYEEA
jgi:hypothetical protein